MRTTGIALQQIIHLEGRSMRQANQATMAIAGLALASAFAMPCWAQTPAAQTKGAAELLAPHRAVYEITLDQTRSGGGITDMSGRMVYELTGSVCEGYTQNMRFVTRMTTQDGSATLTDLRTSSWEDALARQLRFNSSQYKDTKLSESTQGDASRQDAGSEVKVELLKPAKKEKSIRAGVHFPIQHSIALLAAAKKGDTVFQADLYDGSEKGEKFYATTAYIGRVQAKGHNKTLPPVASAAPLDGMQSWPVSISYFDPAKEKQDGLPAYELAFLYFENGVSRRLFIDYGDFAIRGALKELQFIEPTKCEQKK
jgi:EipB-like